MEPNKKLNDLVNPTDNQTKPIRKDDARFAMELQRVLENIGCSVEKASFTANLNPNDENNEFSELSMTWTQGSFYWSIWIFYSKVFDKEVSFATTTCKILSKNKEKYIGLFYERTSNRTFSDISKSVAEILKKQAENSGGIVTQTIREMLNEGIYDEFAENVKKNNDEKTEKITAKSE